MTGDPPAVDYVAPTIWNVPGPNEHLYREFERKQSIANARYHALNVAAGLFPSGTTATNLLRAARQIERYLRKDIV